MFEAEFEQAKSLMSDVYEVLDGFYNADLDAKQKVAYLEEATAKISLLLAYLIQTRYTLLIQSQNIHVSGRTQLNYFLNEIKVQLDSIKTMSFNFTTLLNSARDKVKSEYHD